MKKRKTFYRVAQSNIKRFEKTKKHPNIKAIEILELTQSYMCKKCVKNTDGENWYILEDKIMEIINAKH